MAGNQGKQGAYIKLIQFCVPSSWDPPAADSRWRQRRAITFVVGIHLVLMRSHGRCLLAVALFLVVPSSECPDIFPHPRDGGLSLAYPIQNFSYSSDIDRLQGMSDGPLKEMLSDPDSPLFDRQLPDRERAILSAINNGPHRLDVDLHLWWNRGHRPLPVVDRPIVCE